jgi:hypothetical protein
MGNFSVRKDASGRFRWLGIYTNSFIDLDREILTAEAHKEMVEAANDGLVPMPSLWLCHNQEWEIGGTDLLAIDEVYPGALFVVASGTFKDGMEGVALRLADVSAAMSHGFVVTKTGSINGAKTIESYRTFEISVLPDGVAVPANPRTYYVVEEGMAITTDLRAKLATLLGQDIVETIENTNVSIADKALGDGVQFKSVDDETPVEEEVAEHAGPVADSDKTEPEVEEQVDAPATVVSIEEFEGFAAIVGEALKAKLDEFAQAQKEFQEEIALQMAQVRQEVAQVQKQWNQAQAESVTPEAARPSYEAFLRKMMGDQKSTAGEALPPQEASPAVSISSPIGYIAALVEER